ncbi:tRNA 2-thiocytidine(32) synthetase TtcA [Alkalilimnicola sp. S0819]|uniref:tRNA 2-thiocytidine(32) synthetase TtcA n=1 Tax=Alkalilimnicola sp. S0819 TaxID=2613922 RepID=UPI0012623774|nr:tRNA 2-thiocytidine(32) synthetase TtcA [Alkalilimnicola sp. S0819]KAB7623676.1 tRNA 2-thiocytidine(32) synthetase TtcA [Alkalilimnicola sp. S0819]MPQ16803.1 tRNA 2-thiocytidine(32) synthetase TtcA [Alkalilimnicola sp. S0819]
MNLKNLEKRLSHLTGSAIRDYRMIEEGDRIMVCLSGGKDSYTLLEMLRLLQTRAPVRFELIAVNLDQKQPGWPEHILPEYLEGLGVSYRILEQDTYSVVKRVLPEGKTMCSLCSRLRRGALYSAAEEMGISKIALGHHRDDILATLFLNMFYGAKLAAMPPKLRSNDGRHVVIRPLAYVPERYCERYAALKQFPIIPCNLCGSQENLKRAEIGRMLKDWERAEPKRLHNIFRSLSNVNPSHLADPELYDFQGLQGGFTPDGPDDPLAAIESPASQHGLAAWSQLAADQADDSGWTEAPLETGTGA